MLKNILFLVCLFFLMGCSVDTDFYLQNRSETSVVVNINYKRPVSNPGLLNENSGFEYKEEILEPKRFRKNTALKKLTKKQTGDSTISIEIPKHSTVRIEKTYNFIYTRNIQSVDISGQRFSLRELQNASIKKKNDYIYCIQ